MKEERQQFDGEGSQFKTETLEQLVNRAKALQVEYNAVYTAESNKLTDDDMVNMF